MAACPTRSDRSAGTWCAPDQLGTLLAGIEPQSDLWFLDELVDCAEKVLARSGGGDLHFVGRSLDSLHDLLGGALSGTRWLDRLHQVPLSFSGYGLFGTPDPEDTAQLRVNLAACGLAPADLARGGRPIVLVDIVSTGRTFENLYTELRRWVADARGSWDVVRRRLRILGITRRTHTSPKTWRWQQHAEWTADLPARAVRNISLDSSAYSYFADHQVKLSQTFWHAYWSDERVTSPRHDHRTLRALAEAVAVVEAGRAKRDQLLKHLR